MLLEREFRSRLPCIVVTFLSWEGMPYPVHEMYGTSRPVAVPWCRVFAASPFSLAVYDRTATRTGGAGIADLRGSVAHPSDVPSVLLGGMSVDSADGPARHASHPISPSDRTEQPPASSEHSMNRTSSRRAHAEGQRRATAVVRDIRSRRARAESPRKDVGLAGRQRKRRRDEVYHHECSPVEATVAGDRWEMWEPSHGVC